MKKVEFLTIFVLVLVGYSMAADYETIQITNFFRHGARAPNMNYFKLDWVESVGLGNLTGVGMRQHYVLGKQIKELYPELLDYKTFNNFNIFAKSSQSYRTIQSAISHLNGIFQPGNSIDEGFGLDVTSNNTENLMPNYSPITYKFEQSKALPFGYGVFPVVTENSDMDFNFKVDHSCPRLSMLRDDANNKQDKLYEGVAKMTYDALDKVGLKPSKFSGDDNKGWNLVDLQQAHEGLFTDLYQTGQMYPGTDAEFYDKLHIAYGIFTLLYYPDETVLRLFTNGISHLIVEGMESRIKGTKKHKLVVLSGHDGNLMPFMMKFGLTSLECAKEMYEKGSSSQACEIHPHFASSFIFELNKRKSDGDHFVRILYNGKPFKFCGANEDDFYCKYAMFKEKLADTMYLEDFANICGNPYYEVSGKRASYFIVLVCVCCLALVGLILALYFACRYQKLLRQSKMPADESEAQFLAN